MELKENDHFMVIFLKFLNVKLQGMKIWEPKYDCAIYEPRHEIANNVVCATSKASDQPAHTHSLIRALASCLNIL